MWKNIIQEKIQKEKKDHKVSGKVKGETLMEYIGIDYRERKERKR